MADILKFLPWGVGVGGLSAIVLAAWFAARADAARDRANRRLMRLRSEIVGIMGWPEAAAWRSDWPERIREKLAKEKAELDTFRRSAASCPAAPLRISPMIHADARSLIDIAICALNEAYRILSAASSKRGLTALDEALGFQSGIKRSIEALNSAPQTDGLETIENEFRAGTFNHVFSASTLFSTYFEGDLRFIQLAANYRLACASLIAALAARGIAVRMARPLTAVQSGTLRVDAIDRRNLRRIEEIKLMANRAADKLAQGEVLVVDCPVPGWVSETDSRSPEAVIWDRASWLS